MDQTSSDGPNVGQLITQSRDDRAFASLDSLLDVVRNHLDVDVAFVSCLRDDEWTMHEVVAPPSLDGVLVKGASIPAHDTYCSMVNRGQLPNHMGDTSKCEVARALPATDALSFRSYVSVPIHLPDGALYGMFCAFGFTANDSLNERDVKMMRAFAELAGHRIALLNECEDARTAAEANIVPVLQAPRERIGIVLQPLWDLRSGSAIGVEALSRFDAEPRRGPDQWFAEAEAIGRRCELEIAALREALAALEVLPREARLWLNVSPASVFEAEFHALLAGQPLDRLVLELTEHMPVEDYDALATRLGPLRQAGLRLAVDDAGGGYASMKHVLNLRPDIIKVDMAVTHGVDTCGNRRALMAAFCAFAAETRAKIVAEGVETAGELDELRRLGVDIAQGYHLGRPVAASALGDVFARARCRSVAGASAAPTTDRGLAGKSTIALIGSCADRRPARDTAAA